LRLLFSNLLVKLLSNKFLIIYFSVGYCVVVPKFQMLVFQFEYIPVLLVGVCSSVVVFPVPQGLDVLPEVCVSQ